jgi:prepilin-type N-terminal cleavage/methylation domain-containing protein
MKKSKGFSLVELIIVIAIMAILVGILAPNLMKNIEKSRYSKDKTIVDNCATALINALADPEAYDSLYDGTSSGSTTGSEITTTVSGSLTLGGPTWQKEIKDGMKGMEGQKFSSKKAGKGVSVGTCKVVIKDDGGVHVETPNGNIKIDK